MFFSDLCAARLPARSRSRLAARRGDQEAIVGLLGDLAPGEVIVAIAADLIQHLLELDALAGDLGQMLAGRLVARFENGLRKRLQDCAGRHELAQRGRIERIVLGAHVAHRGVASAGEDGLVGLRQRVPLLKVDDHVQHAAAFPPAGIVVEARELHEAGALVVVRADELGGIKRAVLERRKRVDIGHLIRDGAKALQDRAAHADHAHPQALQVLDGVQLLAEPAAHLRAADARGHGDHVETLQSAVDGILAAAELPPGDLLALVEAEGNAGAEDEDWILGRVIRERRERALDTAAADSVEGLAARGQLARQMRLDDEAVVRRLGHEPAQRLHRALHDFEGFAETRGEAPLHFRRGLGECRSRDRRRCQRRERTAPKELPSLHPLPLPARGALAAHRVTSAHATLAATPADVRSKSTISHPVGAVEVSWHAKVERCMGERSASPRVAWASPVSVCGRTRASSSGPSCARR